MEIFNQDFSSSSRDDLGVPVMCGWLLGLLLVSPSVQCVFLVHFLTQPAKDVARATSLTILVKSYTSCASPGPQGDWCVGVWDLSLRVGTPSLGSYSHQVFTHPLRSVDHWVLTSTSPPHVFWVFTHPLWGGCILPTHGLILTRTCRSQTLRGILRSLTGFPIGVRRLSGFSSG